MTLEAQAQKLIAGLVRVAVMAPVDTADPPDVAPNGAPGWATDASGWATGGATTGSPFHDSPGGAATGAPFGAPPGNPSPGTPFGAPPGGASPGGASSRTTHRAPTGSAFTGGTTSGARSGTAPGAAGGDAAGGGAAERAGLPLPHRQVLLLLGRRDREFRLSDLAAELGSTVAATMAVVSPLVAGGLVEMRPAPSYAAHDMRVAATEHGLALTPAPSNWAEIVLGQVEDLDEATRTRLLRVVTNRITALQQEGRIPVTRMCLSCRFFDGHRHPGTETPHHCWFVDAPFGYRQLRLHCPDHVPGGAPRTV